MPDQQTDDIRTLMLQVHAGILLLEDILDDTVGGDWVKPSRRESHASRYAWGQLCIAWLNLGTLLLQDPDVEPWTVPPLVSRTSGKKHSVWEFGKDGRPVIEPFDGVRVELDRVPGALVRPIDQPKEPKYTLDEARAILEICQNHVWGADLDEEGRPMGVVCSGCGERRPLR